MTRASIAKSHDSESARSFFHFWIWTGGREKHPLAKETEVNRGLSDRLVFGQRMLIFPEYLPGLCAFAQSDVAKNGYATLIYVVFGISHLTAFLPWDGYEVVNNALLYIFRPDSFVSIIPTYSCWLVLGRPGEGQNTADLLWVYNLVLHSGFLG